MEVWREEGSGRKGETLVSIKQISVPPISSLGSSGDLSGQRQYPEFNDDMDALRSALDLKVPLFFPYLYLCLNSFFCI